MSRPQSHLVARTPTHPRAQPINTAEAQKAQGQVTFLMNPSNELRRKVPVGKLSHTPLMAELPRKQVIRNVFAGWGIYRQTLGQSSAQNILPLPNKVVNDKASVDTQNRPSVDTI